MRRLIDLTRTLGPGVPGFSWETARTVERDGWNARTLHLYSHCATHMDAQTHFDCGPGTIDETSLDRCMGRAHVVDLMGLPARRVMTIWDLGRTGSLFRPGDSLLLRTGWSRHASDPEYYRSSFPRVGDELARWCVENEVRMLGVEAPSVADVHNLEEVTRIHEILLRGNVNIIEGLVNLDELKTTPVWLIALPLKVGGGDGAPCRVLAIDGDQSLGESTRGEGAGRSEEDGE